MSGEVFGYTDTGRPVIREVLDGRWRNWLGMEVEPNRVTPIRVPRPDEAVVRRSDVQTVLPLVPRGMQNEPYGSAAVRLEAAEPDAWPAPSANPPTDGSRKWTYTDGTRYHYVERARGLRWQRVRVETSLAKTPVSRTELVSALRRVGYSILADVIETGAQL